jgi:hypothetical protein
MMIRFRLRGLRGKDTRVATDAVQTSETRDIDYALGNTEGD